MKSVFDEDIFKVASFFDFEGTVKEVYQENSGHINDTYHVVTSCNCYILQRLNRNIFRHPKDVMGNILDVSAQLVEHIVKRGGDPEKECLVLVKTKEGRALFKDKDGFSWRAFKEMEHSKTLLYSEDPVIICEMGRALGRFNADLIDSPIDDLKETIPHFHDTEKRYQDFLLAIKNDKASRKEEMKEILEEMCSYSEFSKPYQGIALHITHNDPKLPNILLSDCGKKALCLVDFDTIMPGYIPDDVGDALRSGASNTDEDEPDLSKVGLNITLYKAFLNGYFSEARDVLDEPTKEQLVYGLLKMTYELTLRFMTDYLNGDEYFKISYPKHNKVRALCQFTLFKDIVSKRELLEDIVRSLS